MIGGLRTNHETHNCKIKMAAVRESVQSRNKEFRKHTLIFFVYLWPQTFSMGLVNELRQMKPLLRLRKSIVRAVMSRVHTFLLAMSELNERIRFAKIDAWSNFAKWCSGSENLLSRWARCHYSTHPCLRGFQNRQHLTYASNCKLVRAN